MRILELYILELSFEIYLFHRGEFLSLFLSLWLAVYVKEREINVTICLR